MTGLRRCHALLLLVGTLLVGGGVLAATPIDPQAAGETPDPGMEVLHGAHIMHAKGAAFATTTNNLTYHGGTNGNGVETAPDTVYLVYWGSQWNNNDPSGEAAIQQAFFPGVVMSSWNDSVTQYCQGVPSGTVSCNGAGTPATNGGAIAGIWYDNSSAAPSHPRHSQLAAEAGRAAQHFANA